MTLDIEAEDLFDNKLQLRQGAVEAAVRQTARIAVAANSLQQRLRLLNSLVIPKVWWGAQWQTFSDDTMYRLEQKVESLICPHNLPG